MTHKLAEFFINLFSGLQAIPYGRELTVFIISLMPILELRGGLIAASLLGLNPINSYIISIIANILPVPFILWLIKAILKWMQHSNIRFFRNIANWLFKKVDKHKVSIEKYGFWGLVFFVGVPLPGTGAWTGALVAAMIDMDRKKALWAILLGILIASVIMMLLSFGIIGRFLH